MLEKGKPGIEEPAAIQPDGGRIVDTVYGKSVARLFFTGRKNEIAGTAIIKKIA